MSDDPANIRDTLVGRAISPLFEAHENDGADVCFGGFRIGMLENRVAVGYKVSCIEGTCTYEPTEEEIARGAEPITVSHKTLSLLHLAGVCAREAGKEMGLDLALQWIQKVCIDSDKIK